VHAFTASGVFFGFLALLEVVAHRPRMALLWLALAQVVDGVDGTLARAFSVREVLPGIDGAVLDLVVDYVTYVLVPALFILTFVALPPGLGLATAFLILFTSLYCFSNVGMKSADYYFVGFPAMWNAVALYLFLLELPPVLSFAGIVVLAAATFTRWEFVHPFRVAHFRLANLAATVLWLVTSAVLVVRHPGRPAIAFAGWLLATAWFGAVSAWRTARVGPPRRQAGHARGHP
jgi:phosphatidylcholine synthase